MLKRDLMDAILLTIYLINILIYNKDIRLLLHTPLALKCLRQFPLNIFSPCTAPKFHRDSSTCTFWDIFVHTSVVNACLLSQQAFIQFSTTCLTLLATTVCTWISIVFLLSQLFENTFCVRAFNNSDSFRLNVLVSPKRFRDEPSTTCCYKSQHRVLSSAQPRSSFVAYRDCQRMTSSPYLRYILPFLALIMVTS